MKWILISLKLILLPFSLMIIVNENVNSINQKTCSWECHNNTNLCKQNHTLFLKPYLNKIDIPYHFIIQSLANTGNYKQANIIFLVVLWPLFMLGLTISNLFLYQKLKNGKSR